MDPRRASAALHTSQSNGGGDLSIRDPKKELRKSESMNDTPALIKAYKGLVTDNEYTSSVRVALVNENKKSEEATQVSLNYHSIDYNSDKSLLPVIDFEDRVKFSGRSSLILKNNNKDTISFEIEIFDNPKLVIDTNPKDNTELKSGQSVEIFFDVRIFCTTRIIQVVRININKVKKKGLMSKKKSSEELGKLFVALKMQTDLSTSLDNDEIKRSKEIGRGAYGVVYKASYREEEIALKELNIEQLVEEELILVKRELANMSKIKSRYIVQYIGATLIRGQPVCLAMEYLTSGNLTKLLESQPLSTYFKAKLALDVAKGMNYLHANNIGHRDLKSDNVLVFASQEDAPLNLKITDFGTSKASIAKKPEGHYAIYSNISSAPSPSSQQSERNSSKGVGTPIYQAPEILEGSSTFDDKQIDVYSYGVLLYQIFSQVQPYSQPPYDTQLKDVRDIANFIRAGKRMAIPKEWPSDIRDLIDLCWCQEPSDRPSFAQVIVPSLTKITEKLYLERQNDNNGSLSSSTSSYNLSPARRSESQIRDSPSQKRSNLNSTNRSPSSNINHSTSSTDQVNSESSSAFYGGNIPTPPGRLEKIGWWKEISRGDTVDKLQNCPKGTFLIRWSGNRGCFVLSYQNSSGKAGVKHIDSIFLNKEGKVEVLRADNSRPCFETMEDYIQTLKDVEKILNNPLPFKDEEESTYMRY